MIPGMIPAALSFAFLKISSYGLLFWLPTFLQQTFDMGEVVSTISSMVEIGQIFSVPVLGYITDKAQMRFFLFFSF